MFLCFDIDNTDVEIHDLTIGVDEFIAVGTHWNTLEQIGTVWNALQQIETHFWKSVT